MRLHILYVVIFNLAIIGGTAYIVFWKGRSPWWFALAVCLLWDLKVESLK